ncbi:hypothetical protein LSCM4_03941 [Leishmania orientalis]|uniref:Methyltransferase n=1 Tax=Leishmania orientalis TaxID=2249476 RepID=A0A836GZF1_9TRYP|nr:hypothetical protein LSCM4_03941 [Leishmania orientalis]
MCSIEHTFPRSLILFLQSAPPNIVLSAFQTDCEGRNVTWCSAEAQMLAVEWFVQHPVVKQYPPRLRMVRTLLKTYITSVEEQHVADCALSSTSSEDPVRTELMEEFIRVNVLGDASEQQFCFKTFYNPLATAPGTPATRSAPTAPALPSDSPMLLSATPMLPLARLTMANSSPAQGHPTSADSLPRASSPEMHASTAPRSLRQDVEPAHTNLPHCLPPCIVANGGSEALLSMASVHSPPTSPEKSSPMHRLHLQPCQQQQLLSPHFPAQTPASATAVTPARVLDQFSAIRVSREQFSNVGLSLWPAAFVMVQLLAQELKGQTRMLADVLGLPRVGSGGVSSTASSEPLRSAPNNGRCSHAIPAPLPPGPVLNSSLRSGESSSAGSSSRGTMQQHSGQLRILELGAGAGLTPVYLHHMKEYNQHVTSFLATDYQQTIVDNMRFNMAENGIRLLSNSLAAKCEAELDERPPHHRAALLNWMNHDDNEVLFRENEVDVTLVADCIYDADVIPALVDTIHLALTTRGAASSAEGDGDTATADVLQKQRCCIVVQTHRLNSTMQKFFSAVRAFGQVRSYTLVRQRAGLLRISKDHSGIDGGCVPLGDWDEQLLLRHPDRVVCALMPDVILEDGSMRYASLPQHGDSANETATAVADRFASPLPPPASPVALVGTSGVATAVGELPKPLQSSRSTDSASSPAPISCSPPSAASSTEAQLAAEMIGPFYTSMVGLIGVHVITLKPAKVAR